MNVPADIERSPGGVDVLHGSRCWSQLNNILIKHAIKTDVWFTVGDKRLGAHQIVLSAASRVFFAIFEGMKETQDRQIVLTDVDPNDFQEFLNFIYSGNQPNFEHHAVQLLALAHKYQVSRLFDLCSQHFLINLHELNACEILSLADLYGLGPLKDKAIAFIRDNIETVVSTEGWKEIAENSHLGSLVAGAIMNLPKQSTYSIYQIVAACKSPPYNPRYLPYFTEVLHNSSVLCQTKVKTINWIIDWITVLAEKCLHSNIFTLKIYEDEKPMLFRLYFTKQKSKQRGIAITFWIEVFSRTENNSDIIQLECLTVLHSALPGGEYRQSSTFKWDWDKWDQARKICSFFVDKNHYSVDNGLRLSLTFLQPGHQCRILNESPGQGLNKVSVIKRTEDFADVFIIVDRAKFSAHKLILASQSDYFAELFKKIPMAEYILEGVDPQSFDTVLNFMYCRRFPELKDICITLLKTAAVLRLEELLRFCSPVIAENITVDHAVDLFLVGQIPGAEALKESSVKFIGSNLEEIMSSTGWQKLFVQPNQIISQNVKRRVKESAPEFKGTNLEDVISSSEWPMWLINSSQPNPFTELVIALYNQKLCNTDKPGGNF